MINRVNTFVVSDVKDKIVWLVSESELLEVRKAVAFSLWGYTTKGLESPRPLFFSVRTGSV